MSSIKSARIAVVYSVFVYLLWNVLGSSRPATTDHTSAISDRAGLSTQPVLDHLACQNLSGADETLAVLRTGSTEPVNRLAIHLLTSLRCFSNHLVFSDFEEDFHGEQVLDAIADVSSDVLSNHPDFELHRRLRQHG